MAKKDLFRSNFQHLHISIMCETCWRKGTHHEWRVNWATHNELAAQTRNILASQFSIDRSKAEFRAPDNDGVPVYGWNISKVYLLKLCSFCAKSSKTVPMWMFVVLMCDSSTIARLIWILNSQCMGCVRVSWAEMLLRGSLRPFALFSYECLVAVCLHVFKLHEMCILLKMLNFFSIENHWLHHRIAFI